MVIQKDFGRAHLKDRLKADPKVSEMAQLTDYLMGHLMGALMGLQMAQTMVSHSAHQRDQWRVELKEDSRVLHWGLPKARRKVFGMAHLKDRLKVIPKVSEMAQLTDYLKGLLMGQLMGRRMAQTMGFHSDHQTDQQRDE